MATVAQTIRLALPGIRSAIISILVKLEDARIAISIGNENGTIRPRYRGSQAPFVRRMKSCLGRSSDLLHHRSIRLHFDKQPVLLRSSLLHRDVEILVIVFV